jgi:hypothetical protein
MIDAHGHIVLTDFSCARRIGSSGGQCHRDDGGEFEDLGVSPGWGDEFAVDYWSLGVLLHLLLFGTVASPADRRLVVGANAVLLAPF